MQQTKRKWLEFYLLWHIGFIWLWVVIAAHSFCQRVLLNLCICLIHRSNRGYGQTPFVTSLKGEEEPLLVTVMSAWSCSDGSEGNLVCFDPGWNGITVWSRFCYNSIVTELCSCYSRIRTACIGILCYTSITNQWVRTFKAHLMLNFSFEWLGSMWNFTVFMLKLFIFLKQQTLPLSVVFVYF